MSSSLLCTKLFMPPARPGLVPRPRLTTRLTAGMAGPLIVISAPAGFGKTTLLAEWRSTSPGRDYELGWLSLDPEDNDPPRFWAYVVAALRTLSAFSSAPALGAASLEILRTGPTVAPEHFLLPLLNELAASPAPFALVLDDYHAIVSQAVHTAVQYLISHLPPQVHLIVLTRADPPWPLARLRSLGLLTELRAADLRFTDEEAAAVLGRTPGGSLPAEDVVALQRRTEGWPAAVQLASLSLAGLTGSAERRAFISAFAGEHRYIADYLAEEVISRQPEQVQAFLMRTVILEQMTAPLCATVSGQRDADCLLAYIDRANLFLIPLDGEGRWFRYHHLFADLLRARLRRLEPDLVPTLHLRASEWHEAAGQPFAAVTYALAGEDYDRATRLVEQNVHDWWGLASSEFLRLMERLPDAVIRTQPTLAVYQAWIGIVTGRLEIAAALIEAAEHRLGTDLGAGADAKTATLWSFVDLMRAYILELTGKPRKLSASVLEAPRHIPPAHAAMRNSADVVLAYLLYMDGDLEQAAALLSAAAERDLTANLTNAVPIAVSRLVRICMIQGRLSEAEALCRRYLSLITGAEARRHFVNGSLNAALAEVLAARNALDEAGEQASEAVAQNEFWQVPNALVACFLVQARVQLTKGDLTGAAESLARAEASARGRTIMNDVVSLHQLIQVRLWLAQGNVTAARQWADSMRLGIDDPLSFRQEAGHLALARILLAEGRSVEAQALLSRLAVAAAEGGRLGRLIDILALQALALRRQNPERALGSLEQALVLAEPERNARAFLDEGRPMADMLRQLIDRNSTARAYAAMLLAGQEPAVVPPEELVEPLTSRELEVLHLLIAGLSNEEMARQLTVSVGTIKTHVHNVYGKLGVTGRMRAVARARELRLI